MYGVFTKAFREVESGRSFELGNEGIRLKNSNTSLILQNLYDERKKIMTAIDKSMDYTTALSLMLRVKEIDKKISELGGEIPA